MNEFESSGSRAAGPRGVSAGENLLLVVDKLVMAMLSLL
jgi:hypothetical protein